VLVRGIAHDQDQVKVTVRRVPDQPGIAAKIFSLLNEMGVNVDMIVQNMSEDGYTDISFTISTGDIEKTSPIIERIKREVGVSEVVTTPNIAKVSVVGIGMRSHTGVAQKVFRTLGERGINIMMISTSEIKISVVVDRSRADEAVIALHDAFDLGNEKGNSNGV
jgi:aspartate kinase